MEKETNDFLKQKMSVDELGINEPRPELVSEARKKILMRKKEMKEENSFFSLKSLLNVRIKLYQAALASVLIAFAVFYFAKNENGDEDNRRVIQYASVDSLNSSSTKDNRFLVRNFVTTFN